MRGFRFFICSALTVAGVLVLSVNVLSYDHPQFSIRFNLGIWDMYHDDGKLGITVHHTNLDRDERLTEVLISGISGSLAFSRMIGDRFAWELSLGGFYNSESETIDRKIDGR